MSSKTTKVGIGAGFGCVVGLSALFVMLASYPSWAWIAFLIGFVVGWLAYDFKAVLTAVQSAAKAFPGTLHALRERRRQFHADNPLRRRLYLWRFIAALVSLTPIAIIAWLYKGPAYDFAQQNDFCAKAILAIAIIVPFLTQIVRHDVFCPASNDKEKIERHKGYVFRFNLVAIVIYWFPYVLICYVIGNFHKWAPPIVLAVWKTIIAIFKALHSAERLISGSYATVGMGICYLLCDNNNLPLVVDIILGGLLSAALGMVDYRLIKKYRREWLPANGTA